ncbi:MAG TPA: hypothetical protein DCF63_01135, partial [Planctomycetaceae bacterium]|nr:hypothetical protein [Planctomycetaceae bacterium]
WAFGPISQPQLPVVQNWQQAQQPLDLFVFQKLELAGVAWSGSADPVSLVRRVFLDVTGLPPSPEQLKYWTSQWSQDRYTRLVDQLLADLALGEKWARMWLDVVRYAESNSYERDNPKPNAWMYRDYVIGSFNSDRPYDEFVRHQIAGDEVQSPSTDSLIATAFYRLGIWDDEPADPLQAQFDEFDDLVSTVGQAFLGLTLGCARCHDHKIDPITQRDYYAMLALMRDVTTYGTRADQVGNNQLDLYPEAANEHRQAESNIRKLKRRMEKLEKVAIEKMSAPDQRATEGPEREQVLQQKLRDYLDESQWKNYQAYQRELSQVHSDKSKLPTRTTTLGLAKLHAQPPTTYVLLRGSPHNQGDRVDPSFPEILGGGDPVMPQPASNGKSPGRRLVLAEWLSSKDNWLTARVIVNRVWMHFFGRGIVRSPNNFGLMGDPPTHRELLDFLAVELMNSDWSLKQLQRQILLSTTYQRSSQSIVASASADPANQLFWRQNLRRLSAEQVRDSVLKISGQLNLQQAGPPMYPELSAEVLASQSQPGNNWEKSPPDQQARRSIYIHVKRSLPVPMLSVFDFPETDSSCEARFLTVQPGQSLTMLNSQWMQQQAQSLLERLQREVGNDLWRQAKRCLELVTGVTAMPEDVAELVALVERLQVQETLSDAAARRGMCLVALNLNQMIYLD